MASFTIEDIETIRIRSGISYEEAVALLEYHNGDLHRALIDLERNGKLRSSESDTRSAKKSAPARGKFVSFLQRLYRTRIKVHKGEILIANLSVLYMLLAVVIFSPHLAIASLILCLLLGYRINIDTSQEADFSGESLERMVRSAADNVKNTVVGVARDISQAAGEKKTAAPQQPAPEAKTAAAPEAEAESFFKDSPAAIVRDLEAHEQGTGETDVPILQMPVRVDSTDGSISVGKDNGGYSTATVE